MILSNLCNLSTVTYYYHYFFYADVDSVPDDAIGWNTYGLLAERQNLDQLSIRAFERFAF